MEDGGWRMEDDAACGGVRAILHLLSSILPFAGSTPSSHVAREGTLHSLRCGRSPDRATGRDRRSPEARETCGRAIRRGQETRAEHVVSWKWQVLAVTTDNCLLTTDLLKLPLDHPGRHQHAMVRSDALERHRRRFAGGRAGVVAPQSAQAVFITGSTHAALMHGRPAAPTENDFTKEERHGGLRGEGSKRSKGQRVDESVRAIREGRSRMEDGRWRMGRTPPQAAFFFDPRSSILDPPFPYCPGGLVKTAVDVPAVAVPLAGAVAGGALGSSVAGSGAPSASESLTTKG